MPLHGKIHIYVFTINALRLCKWCVIPIVNRYTFTLLRKTKHYIVYFRYVYLSFFTYASTYAAQQQSAKPILYVQDTPDVYIPLT